MRDPGWLIWVRVGAVVLALLASIAVVVEGGRLGLMWLRWIPAAILLAGAGATGFAAYRDYRISQR